MAASERQMHARLLEAAAEVAPAGVFVIAPTGAIVAANRFACSMLGYARADLLGKNLSELALSPRLLGLAEGETATIVGITPLRHHDGSTLIVRYEASHIPTKSFPLVVLIAHPRRMVAADVTPQQAAARGPRVRDNRNLTERESEILQLIAEGLDNDEISTQLYISLETVKSHVRRLLQKLGARSRTHAVAVALRRDLID